MSLLADTLTDDHDAAATLDAALVMANSRDERWYIPELMRRRAAYDGPEQAIGRLAAAAGIARRQDSGTLLLRCERDLAGLSAVDER